MADFKTNLSRLAASIVEDALKPATSLETRIAALKAVTSLHLGISKIGAQLKIKGVIEDDGNETVTDFRALRSRVRAVNDGE